MRQSRSWAEKGDARRLGALALAYAFILQILAAGFVTTLVPAGAAGIFICGEHALHGLPGADARLSPDGPAKASPCLPCPFCVAHLGTLPTVGDRMIQRRAAIVAAPSSRPYLVRAGYTTAPPTPPRGPPYSLI
ncbi:hypothetical protein SAMN07250955_11653 [Arboricoccus pini]|uniref:DUF2946 domain-containing protein n=1 Tax=Arboricoccus pini TaxID=1963835 RepID=A0A212RX92_9PROT|nr:hypothetical protein [Arboricoccus pini]SNB77276.1 hypothetical protein SAMN07250955_11653 [Arboricoccus pini]